MEKMKPEKAVEILAKHGTPVTSEEARLILDFMYKLAEIALTQYVNNETSRFIHPGQYGRTGGQGIQSTQPGRDIAEVL